MLGYISNFVSNIIISQNIQLVNVKGARMNPRYSVETTQKLWIPYIIVVDLISKSGGNTLPTTRSYIIYLFGYNVTTINFKVL